MGGLYYKKGIKVQRCHDCAQATLQVQYGRWAGAPHCKGGSLWVHLTMCPRVLCDMAALFDYMRSTSCNLGARKRLLSRHFDSWIVYFSFGPRVIIPWIQFELLVLKLSLVLLGRSENILWTPFLDVYGCVWLLASKVDLPSKKYSSCSEAKISLTNIVLIVWHEIVIHSSVQI